MDYPNKIIPIVKEAGDALRPYFGKASVLKHKTDEAWDVVTELDQTTERFLAENLQKVDSSIGFFGEEFGGNREQERFWLCDPIDGTAHFIRGLPYCTVMLALIAKEKVVFSAIYDFMKQDMYWAELGNGAFRNEEQIRVSDRPLVQSLVSFETHIEKKENMEKFVAVDKAKATPFHTANCGFEYAMIASGKLDARISLEPYGSIWDFAPGCFLVQEAGGVAANIGKETYDYRDLNSIVSNSVVYKELTQSENAIFPIEK